MNNDTFRLHAQQNDWSIARVQGFAAGEATRQRGNPPSRYAMIGIDDYSLGFRAGYFERPGPPVTGAIKPQGLLPTSARRASAG
ncbi:MAG: hypothetical protein H7X76_01975 [Prolixibacteraceae bacterium]|nr:hypothetical protein [Burkholderiales bacterium]